MSQSSLQVTKFVSYLTADTIQSWNVHLLFKLYFWLTMHLMWIQMCTYAHLSEYRGSFSSLSIIHLSFHQLLKDFSVQEPCALLSGICAPVTLSRFNSKWEKTDILFCSWLCWCHITSSLPQIYLCGSVHVRGQFLELYIFKHYKS